jgi:DNA primase
MDVAFAVLPEGVDPAELFELPNGKEQWNRAVGEATDALEFQFRRVRAQLDAATTVTGRQHVAEQYLSKLAALGLEQTHMIRKAMVIQRLAEMLHLSEQAITELLKRLAPLRRAQNPRRSAENGGAETSDNRNDNSGLDVASTQHPPKIKALARAERQVIGCLLREPALFHQVISDGRTLDEAITPAEFFTPLGRRLYGELYQRLGDGAGVTMSGVLADLASQDETDLAGLATTAEAEVDAAAGGDVERTRQMLIAAGDAIRSYHEELEHGQARRSFEDKATSHGDGSPQDDQLLRRLTEHRRAHPSPIRIARIAN